MRAGLIVLAVMQGLVGVWALLGPESFYADFPGAGHAWVALLPEYNEHLTRDVGALSLALTVVLVAAAWWPERRLVRIALVALARLRDPAHRVPRDAPGGLPVGGRHRADDRHGAAGGARRRVAGAEFTAPGAPCRRAGVMCSHAAAGSSPRGRPVAHHRRPTTRRPPPARPPPVADHPAPIWIEDV